jgi:hypothetical protein
LLNGGYGLLPKGEAKLERLKVPELLSGSKRRYHCRLAL